MVSVDRLTTGYVGLSTDEKPTVALRNGDTFVEIDTNKLFAWDEDGGQWLEQVSAGGGGGSDDEETTVTIFDGEIELSYESHDGYWSGFFTPQNEPNTTNALTIEVGSGTYTTMNPDNVDVSEGNATWEYSGDDEWLVVDLHQGSYVYITPSALLPSEDQTQTISVKITQVQSSGGSDSSERMIVNISTQDGQTFTADKTFVEVKAAVDAGKDVVAKFAYPGSPINLTYWANMTNSSDTAISFATMSATTVDSEIKGIIFIGQLLNNNNCNFTTQYFDVSDQ